MRRGQSRNRFADRLARAYLASPGDVRAYQAERDRHAPAIFAITQKIASLDWSFDTLKALHGDINACMKAEHPSRDDEVAANPIAA